MAGLESQGNYLLAISVEGTNLHAKVEKLRLTREHGKHFLVYANKHVLLREVCEGSENAHKQSKETC